MMFRQETLIKHAASIDGAVITGVDWQMLSDVFTPIMIDGAAASRSGVLIGSGLRDRLGLSVSDTITLITQTASGDRPTIARRMITGVFRSGIASYDDHVVLTEISDARSILRAGPHQSTAIIVQCDSDDMIPVLRNHVSGSFGNDLTLLTYRDHLASIWNWIELQRRPIPLILSLIAIVSAFTVTSALILTIVSKTRSMAILSTLGLSWWRISGIIGLRAVTITVIGLFWGLTASMMFIIVQRTWKPLSLDGGIYYVSHLPVALDPGILATSALLIFGVSALASIAPMIIAARLKPASALRFR